MSRVVTTSQVPSDGLLLQSLQGAEFADAFSTALLDGDPDTPAGWAAGSLHAEPRWIAVAMAVRNAVVRPLRLKTGPPDGTRSLLPELARTEQEILYGLDDRHLDFRAVLRVADGRVTFATSVRVNNALGRAYWTIVRPIHPIVVRSLLRSMPEPERPGS
jgi:hypothetical protein